MAHETPSMHTNRMSILRRNVFYEESEIPALTRIAHAESWPRVIFWYMVFIAFSALCILSVTNQYLKFMDNPMQTDVAIIRSTQLQVPNFSLCLTGWPSLSSN